VAAELVGLEEQTHLAVAVALAAEERSHLVALAAELDAVLADLVEQNHLVEVVALAAEQDAVLVAADLAESIRLVAADLVEQNHPVADPSPQKVTEP
jgi:cell division protein ZapA (FtsZ GTPase activity inhibitor)